MLHLHPHINQSQGLRYKRMARTTVCLILFKEWGGQVSALAAMISQSCG